MISRRHFVQASMASAGGLLIAARLLASDAAASSAAGGPATQGFGAYLEIGTDGRIFITCPQAEMGQGVHDGLPKILAEELEADWSQVEVRLARADDAFINPITKRHRTANSESTMIYFDLLRRAGATAREMLVTAAARRWDVPAAECRASLSRVSHAASGRSAGFGELAAAAARAGWGRKLPRGHGLGIALSLGFDAYCAQVAEVRVNSGKLHIERITCAFDCGLIVDPMNVEAQVEGGIVWGLSAALNGQIRFSRGAAVETNFHLGPVIRIDELPRIDVHLLRTDHKPGGCGEASVPAVAPALASAIHAATGVRPRRLPFVEAGIEPA